MKALNLQVCYYGNVALYDANLIYPEIASSLLSWVLRCALRISNLRQYSLLGWGFCSKNACGSSAGTLKLLR